MIVFSCFTVLLHIYIHILLIIIILIIIQTYFAGLYARTWRQYHAVAGCLAEVRGKKELIVNGARIGTADFCILEDNALLRKHE